MKTPHCWGLGVCTLVAALLTACVPSLHPFYTEKDLITDKRLLGRWASEKNAWEFAPGNGKSLRVSLTDGNREGQPKKGRFVGHLFKLENHMFLDLVADELDLAPHQSELALASMIPGHLLLLVVSLEPKLEIVWCDLDWAQKHLKANPGAVPHVWTHDNLVLTADTPTLQKFVLAHLGDRQLFGPYSDRGEKLFERAKP